MPNSCAFCFADQRSAPLSKEHLLSRPVAEAFGVDRGSQFARVGSDGQINWTRLDALQVRLVCRSCNQGWMNQLEHEMASVIDWVRAGSRALGQSQLSALRRWALKTHIVAAAIEGATRRFGRDDSPAQVLPEATRARQLYEGDDSVHETVGYAAARAADSSGFAYAFGNPNVEPLGPRYAGRATASATFIRLGPLLLWVVTPFIPLAKAIVAPQELRMPTADLTYGELISPDPGADPLGCITVQNEEHDIDEFLELMQLAVTESQRNSRDSA